jgi:hypothetical protein
MTRLERISAVVEDTLDKLLLNMDKGDDNIYVKRYNFWIELLEQEILSDLKIDTSTLKVSKFMEELICSSIVRQQKIQDILRLYHGWRDGDKYLLKDREKEIQKLYKIH